MLRILVPAFILYLVEIAGTTLGPKLLHYTNLGAERFSVDERIVIIKVLTLSVIAILWVLRHDLSCFFRSIRRSQIPEILGITPVILVQPKSRNGRCDWRRITYDSLPWEPSIPEDYRDPDYVPIEEETCEEEETEVETEAFWTD